MKVRLVRSFQELPTPSVLAVGLFEGAEASPKGREALGCADRLAPLIAAKEIGTGVGDVTPLLGGSGPDGAILMTFGFGSASRFGPGAAFAAGVALAKRLASKQRGSVAVLLPESEIDADRVSALTEGLVVGTQGPGLRKSEPSRFAFEELILVASESVPLALESLAAAVERGRIVGESVNLARELANLPPAEKTPTSLAERARREATDAGVNVAVWNEGKLREERFGGLLGVAAGSDEPPAYVQLRYRQGGDGPTLALVGKGVTFDSGGLSLKPSASMEDMKSDMTGAAVVLATICGIARLGLPVNVSGAMILTENMTGGRAMKLGDVLTFRNGKTAEILNTDAEGRLILADALSHTVEQKPDRVLDLATLTGACLVALGTKIAGLFSTDDSFALDVADACKRTGERTWRLPLDDDFDDLIKSPVADMKNVGGTWGGAITASKFLQRFVGETPWVHLDIAGPSWAETDSSTRDAGGTGCFVRTLIAMIESGTNPRIGSSGS
jgi:leucyl aminopeptidase